MLRDTLEQEKSTLKLLQKKEMKINDDGIMLRLINLNQKSNATACKTVCGTSMRN